MAFRAAHQKSFPDQKNSLALRRSVIYIHLNDTSSPHPGRADRCLARRHSGEPRAKLAAACRAGPDRGLPHAPVRQPGIPAATRAGRHPAAPSGPCPVPPSRAGARHPSAPGPRLAECLALRVACSPIVIPGRDSVRRLARCRAPAAPSAPPAIRRQPAPHRLRGASPARPSPGKLRPHPAPMRQGPMRQAPTRPAPRRAAAPWPRRRPACARRPPRASRPPSRTPHPVSSGFFRPATGASPHAYFVPFT